jgi:transposase
MTDEAVVEWIRSKYESLAYDLTERAQRRWAAVEALSLGRGGITVVAVATGISDRTIRTGIHELECGESLPQGRQRRSGGGRKRAADKDPELRRALEGLVEPTTRGDPQTLLKWTCKSTRDLSKTLHAQGHQASPSTVCRLLKACGYSLQSNRKTVEGKQHPDRDAQFEYINRRVRTQQRAGQPAISVDAKKKETIGNYRNPGRTWRPKGKPIKVNTYDFPDRQKGKAVPYGVYDIQHNEAWVSIGISGDTAQFAVAAIREWWKRLGRRRYKAIRRLLITADGGGSNSARGRLWKLEIQRLADELGIEIEVCHFPPGTSKWNKIEHRVFCHITRTWRGQPLESYEIIVQLIGSTSTETGLEVHAELDEKTYPKGIKVPAKQFATINLKKHPFHGDWNYTISPREKTTQNR